jgi:actin-like protein 6A
MSSLYTGDSCAGVVVDIGGHSARFGFSGQDMPSVIVPSMVGISSEKESTRKTYYVGQSARLPRSHMELKRPLDLGVIDDYDLFEALLSHGIRELGGPRATNDPNIIARENPLLITEPSQVPATQRDRVAEIAFERFGVPAIFLAKSAVLQAFSVGRSSALIVDIGAQTTRVSPVSDGYVLTRSCVVSEVAGQSVTDSLSDALSKGPHLKDKTVWPRSLLNRTVRGQLSASNNISSNMDIDGADSRAPPRDSSFNQQGNSQVSSSFTSTGAPRWIWNSQRRTDIEYTSSYRTLMTLEILDDMKKSLLNVAEVGYVESDPIHTRDEKSYELPDGTQLKLGWLKQYVPELHFRPEVYEVFKDVMGRRLTATWHLLSGMNVSAVQRLSAPIKNPAGEVISNIAQPFPLQNMITWSLGSCHPELRKDLCQHIILTGGGSCLTGLAQRLKWETLAAVPAAFKPRLLVPTPIERQFGSWIGGSILSSLGTFQQMWVSKAEYEEHGSNILDVKCA